MIEKIKVYWPIKSLKMTCSACPLQYEGKLITGERIYFRDRHGRFSIDIGKQWNKVQFDRFEYTMIGKGDLSSWQAEKIIHAFACDYMILNNVKIPKNSKLRDKQEYIESDKGKFSKSV